jgi:predicted SprT family Zn-dependent metalloprotease
VSFPPRALAARQLASELFNLHGLHDWSFGFSRSKTHMGTCLFVPKVIRLSAYFVELNDGEAVRDTLLHEIAHALVGPGHGHGDVWKAKCREIGARPERLCNDATMPDGRWQARCGGCGMVHHKHRRPKHAAGWWCRHCGPERGRLTWQQAG